MCACVRACGCMRWYVYLCVRVCVCMHASNSLHPLSPSPPSCWQVGSSELCWKWSVTGTAASRFMPRSVCLCPGQYAYSQVLVYISSHKLGSVFYIHLSSFCRGLALRELKKYLFYDEHEVELFAMWTVMIQFWSVFLIRVIAPRCL